MKHLISFIFFAVLVFLNTSVLAMDAAPAIENASTIAVHTLGNAPRAWGGLFCILVFIVSYAAVLMEEKINLRKSKPVLLGAAVIWITIGIMARKMGADHNILRNAVFHDLGEYSSLLLFLLAAMTYIAALQERNVFAVLRAKLVRMGLNLRQIFWVTGIIAFMLSPIADNLTTALVLGAVVIAVGRNDHKFVALSCINIVSAANAGGAFSPFGDITTLMVWQAGHVQFFEFFNLFLPSLTNFILPAFIISFFVSKDLPEALTEDVHLKRGAKRIIFLGVSTIATAVSFEQLLGLPPFLGMMAGLSLLMMMSYHLQVTKKKNEDTFDVFDLVERTEWDTLLFFYGVIFSVGGLAFLGYMDIASVFMYEGFGADITNIALGLSSAIIDNIPVMFAVLSMNPDMSNFEWLLVTLTTGVGGTLLSIGSAAGVGLMGVAHGRYTFLSHLKWTPVLLLGYIAAIAVHYLVNGHMVHP